MSKKWALENEYGEYLDEDMPQDCRHPDDRDDIPDLEQIIDESILNWIPDNRKKKVKRKVLK